MRNRLLTIFIMSFTLVLQAQVGIGTNTPDASAALEIVATSNNKGILIPRLTQAQINAITSPATGLLIFQTDATAGLYYYNGSNWRGFGEVRTVNGQTPAVANGNVAITLLPTQTGTQANRTATTSLTDGLIHIVTGDPTPAENGKVYIYSTATSSWNITSAFTDTDEQDISGSSFDTTTNRLTIGITGGMSQTIDLSALASTDSQTLTLSGTTLSLTNGGAVTLSSGTTNTDSQTLTLAGKILSISAGNSVTLAETDSQTLSLVGQVLSISAGNSVTLTNTNTDSQTLTLAGQVLSISAGNSVTLAETDSQTLSLVGQILSISAGNSVTLTDTNTDSQTLTLAGQVLSISAGNSVTLAETDSQTLSLVGQILSISAGNSVTLTDTNTDSQTLTLAGQVLTISSGNSVTLAETDSQTLSLVGQVLSISAGNSVTLADTNTDTQTLSFISDVLTISGGNSVTIRSLPFTVSDGNTLAWNGTTNQWNAVNDLRVPVAVAADPIQIFKSLIPANTTAELGRSANVFEKVFTKEIRSETASLVFNTGVSSLTVPQIVFEQGSTQIGGFGQNRFFIGSFAGGDYYIFPGTTAGASINDVLTFNGTNALNFNSISALESQNFDDVVALGGTTTRSISVGDISVDGDLNAAGGDINLGTSLSNDTIEVGNSDLDTVVINATLSSTLEVANSAVNLGTNSQELGTVYVQNIDSNSADLEFKRGGNTFAGIDTSNNFFIGQDSATGYTFPTTEPLLVDNQVLAYTASNTLSFLSIATTDSQTIAAALSGTTLELRPENISTASITVDLSVFTNTDTQTLAQVTAQGSQTTDNIQVGGLRSTSYLVVQGSSSLDGDVTLGGAASDDITFQGRVANSIEFKTIGNSIATSSIPLTDIFTNGLKAGSGNDIIIDANSSSQEIEFANNGNTKAGVNSTTFYVGDNTNYYTFPLGTATRVAGQTLTVSSSTGQLYFADKTTNTDSQTLAQVTAEGATTTRTITVGGITSTGDVSIEGNTTLGDGVSDNINFKGRIGSDIIPNSALNLGSSADQWTALYIKSLIGDSSDNPSINFNSDSVNIAGITSQTFFVGDNTTSDYYKFPAGEASPTAGQVLTVSSTTTELYFSTIPTLPFGTNEGNTLRWNATANEWERTSDLRIAPGTGFSPGTALWTNQSLIPSSTTLNIGQSGNEFQSVFTEQVRTDEDYLTLTTDSENIYLKRDSDNLIIQDNTTPMAASNANNVAFGLSTLNAGSSGAEDNVAFGYRTLNAITNGDQNTAIGNYSLSSLQGGLANTAVGYAAAFTLSSGNYNVSVGWNSHRELTTGGNSVGVGVGALRYQTTTSDNTAIGYAAGNRITGGSNTAVGAEAIHGDSGSTGQENTGVGRRALFDLSSGSHNVAIGRHALYNNTTASHNTAVGRSAMLDNTSGNQNVAVGSSALENGTTGAGNVAIGYQALQTNTTGSGNIAIGDGADAVTTSLTNGIAIGQNAVVRSSNSIQLGNSLVTTVTTAGVISATGFMDTSLGDKNEILVVGDNSRIISTDLLTIDESNQHIGIVTSSPSVTLHMVGEATETSQIRMDQHNSDSDAPDIRFYKSRGTQSAPTAVANNDFLAAFNSFAYDGTSYVGAGNMRWYADGTDGDSYFRINTRVGGTDATRFEIDASGDIDISNNLLVDGRLGVGTSVPTETFHIVGESDQATVIRFEQNNNGTDAPDIKFYKSRGTNASPSAVGSGDNLAFVNMFAHDGSDFVHSGAAGWTSTGTSGNSAYHIQTRVSGTRAQRLAIDSNGDTDIFGYLDIESSTAGNFLEFILSGTQRGSINVTTSATSYNTTSDYRLKEDFKDFNGLRLVNDIQVYDYRWKEEGSRSFGVKAHELQNVIPYSVTGERDGDEMQMVDYSKLVPVLTKAIQEQQEQIDTQKQQLESQANQIQALQQMVEQLIEAQE